MTQVQGVKGGNKVLNCLFLVLMVVGRREWFGANSSP